MYPPFENVSFKGLPKSRLTDLNQMKPVHSVKIVYMPFLLHIVPYTERPVMVPPDPFVACCEKSTSPGHG